MFTYCPSCASKKIVFEKGRVFRCACGFTYYHNVASATAGIIETGAGLLFTIRGKDPRRGKLDLPGGFVDPGEGAIDGLRRECIEELGWDPGDLAAMTRAKADGCRLFGSFPNVYPYRGITYNTCDLFFIIDAPDLTKADLHPDPVEVADIRFIKRGELDFNDLAFGSVKAALGLLD
jgi:ADP-ribose pyrophosphatase YjhB (NUDIX family)